eukprot:scaffold158645_cov21-Prasinocladus_malaysianus.AAC.2
MERAKRRGYEKYRIHKPKGRTVSLALVDLRLLEASQAVFLALRDGLLVGEVIGVKERSADRPTDKMTSELQAALGDQRPLYIGQVMRQKSVGGVPCQIADARSFVRSSPRMRCAKELQDDSGAFTSSQYRATVIAQPDCMFVVQRAACRAAVWYISICSVGA